MSKQQTKEKQRVKTKKIAGDKGLYTVPTKLQGKWYSMDKNRQTHSKDTNQLRKIEFGRSEEHTSELQSR